MSFWLKNRGCRIRLLVGSEHAYGHGHLESRGWPTNPITEILDAESTGHDTWQRFDFTYTVPEPYRDIRFELNVLAPGTLWVDDVRIEPLLVVRNVLGAESREPEGTVLWQGVQSDTSVRSDTAVDLVVAPRRTQSRERALAATLDQPPAWDDDDALNRRVLIQGGTFQMGSSVDDSDAHRD